MALANALRFALAPLFILSNKNNKGSMYYCDFAGTVQEFREWLFARVLDELGAGE